MNIGDRIKILRKDLGLTQSEFAEKINLKQAAIGMYENGSRNITEQSISLICSTFNASEEWIRSGSGDMYSPTGDFIINDPSLDAADREILSSYLRMTPVQRQYIKSWIKDIAASISQADQEEDNRSKAHRILDQELDAEKETVSDSTAGLSGTKKA